MTDSRPTVGACDLLLITYEFPFGTGESFLEAELPIAAGSFRRVVLLPNRLRWSDQTDCSRPRAVPDNVEIYDRRSSRRIKLSDLARCLRIVADMRTSLPLGALFSLGVLRESLKAALTLRGIEESLDDCELRRNELIAYSYWKSESATALAYMRKAGALSFAVSRAHGTDAHRRACDPYVAAWIDRVFAVGEYGRTMLLSNGFGPRKVSVARLGVRRMGAASPASIDGVIRIVSCSSMIPLKRISLLVDALACLDVPFHWYHFGEGNERASIEHKIRAMGLTESVTLRGHVPNRELRSWYALNPVDVFVNASSREGVPVSVMEALAHGIPCVVTSVGGSPELIDYRCGAVISASPSPAEIAGAIRAVAEARDLRTGARERWSSIADADSNYQSFYQDLLAARAERQRGARQQQLDS